EPPPAGHETPSGHPCHCRLRPPRGWLGLPAWGAELRRGWPRVRLGPGWLVRVVFRAFDTGAVATERLHPSGWTKLLPGYAGFLSGRETTVAAATSVRARQTAGQAEAPASRQPQRACAACEDATSPNGACRGGSAWPGRPAAPRSPRAGKGSRSAKRRHADPWTAGQAEPRCLRVFFASPCRQSRVLTKRGQVRLPAFRILGNSGHHLPRSCRLGWARKQEKGSE